MANFRQEVEWLEIEILSDPTAESWRLPTLSVRLTLPEPGGFLLIVQEAEGAGRKTPFKSPAGRQRKESGEGGCGGRGRRPLSTRLR